MYLYNFEFVLSTMIIYMQIAITESAEASEDRVPSYLYQ